MTSPTGRRGNGLIADNWRALGLVDPRLSMPLLDRLAGLGVAAYVEPARGDLVVGFPERAHRPLDRLWVDRGRAELARAVLADLTASVSAAPEAEQTDEEFRRIVAGFGQEPSGPADWPAAEDLPSWRPAEDSPTPFRAEPPEADLPGWLEPAAIEDDGHFEPPALPPAPRPRLRTLVAGVAILVGFVLVFAPSALLLPATVDVELLGIAVVAAGAAALVWWMRDAPSDRGPDGGAVV